MSEDMDQWLPMSEDYHSIGFNSYCNGQTAAHMPLQSLPSFGCQKSEPKRDQNVKLCIDGFPSDLTQSGIKNFFNRIGCQVLDVKVVVSKTRVGRHICFADFESTKSAHKAIELIRGQRFYKLSVGFAISKSDKQQKDLLIAKERKAFERQFKEQIDMKPKIDLGNCSAISASSANGRSNMSPTGSQTGSLDSSQLDVLSPLAKTNKLLKVLERAEDDCSFCIGNQDLEHLHFILSDQQLVDPNQAPGLVTINTQCLMCGKKSLEPKLCAQCRNAVYCSQKCQSDNWSKHRIECKADDELSIRSNYSVVRSLNSTLPNGENGAQKGDPIDQVDCARPKPSTPIVPSQVIAKEIAQKQKDLKSGGDFQASKPIDNQQDLTKPKQLSSNKTEIPVQQKVALTSQAKISVQRDTDEEESHSDEKPVPQKTSQTKPVDKEPSNATPIRALETETLVDGESGVSICFGRSPSDFYLQKSTAEANMNLFYDEITSKKDSFPQLADQEFKKGALCGGIYSLDEQCYRARITDRVNPNTFALYFVDYGNTEAVEKKLIKRLPNLFFTCKAQAIPCSLNMTPLGEKWSNEATALFAEMSESNEYTNVKILENSNGVYKIDLFNANGDSICRPFIEKKFAKSTNESETQPKSPVTTPIKSVPAKAFQTSPKVVLNKSSINEVVTNQIPKMASLDEAMETEVSTPKIAIKSYFDAIKSDSKLTLGIASSYNAEEFHYLGSVVDERLATLIEVIKISYPGTKERAAITPSVNDIVVAKGSDGDYYRSFVISVNQSVVKVLMFDSGYIEDVNIGDIYGLDSNLYKYPSFGVLFMPVSKASARLLDLAFTQESLMEGFLLKQNEKLIFKYQNEMVVLLSGQQMFDHVKDTYNLIGKQLHPFDALPLRKLDLDKKLEVLALYHEKEDPKLFFVTKDFDNCEELMGLCAAWGSQWTENIAVNPLPRNVYLVKSSTDNEWYRAVVLEASEEKIHVMFIDFGNEEETDGKYVMELTEELGIEKYQPLAIRCKVESTRLSDNDLKTKIQQAIDGAFLLTIKVVRIEDGFHYVKVY